MMMFFVCNDMEQAWIAQVCADGEREMLEWDRGEDLDREEQLARESVDDGEVDAWPWYADAPCEVVDPEIVDDADLCGLAVEGLAEDFDDELTVEQFDAEVSHVL